MGAFDSFQPDNPFASLMQNNPQGFGQNQNFASLLAPFTNGYRPGQSSTQLGASSQPPNPPATGGPPPNPPATGGGGIMGTPLPGSPSGGGTFGAGPPTQPGPAGQFTGNFAQQLQQFLTSKFPGSGSMMGLPASQQQPAGFGVAGQGPLLNPQGFAAL